jgi:hypothetical protein
VQRFPRPAGGDQFEAKLYQSLCERHEAGFVTATEERAAGHDGDYLGWKFRKIKLSFWNSLTRC